jgi:hypothetical protein
MMSETCSYKRPATVISFLDVFTISYLVAGFCFLEAARKRGSFRFELGHCMSGHEWPVSESG